MLITAQRLLVISDDDSRSSSAEAERATLAGLSLGLVFVATAKHVKDAGGARNVLVRGPGSWLPEARAHLPVTAIKLGFLARDEDRLVAAFLVREARARASGRVSVVAEPRLSSCTVRREIDRAAARHYLRTLAPTGALFSLSLAELSEFAGADPERLAADPAARLEAGRALLELGVAGLVVRAAPAGECAVRDLVLERGRKEFWVERPGRALAEPRGAGTRFATRLAGNLMLGDGLSRAAVMAAEHVFGRPRATVGVP